jgi:hypothetical protein
MFKFLRLYMRADNPGGMDPLERGRHPGLSSSQQRPRLRPSAVHVAEVQGVGELTFPPSARVRHQVHFGKPWNPRIPAVGPDGNLMFQQTARPGATVDASLVAC